MMQFNSFLILPIFLDIKVFITTFDVIHSLGIPSIGIRCDAIPGRINLTSTIKSLFNGSYYGYCFELCGQSHSAMLLLGFFIFINVT